MLILKAAVALAIPLVCFAAWGRKQFAAVRGRITCPQDPKRVDGAEAHLYEKDMIKTDSNMDKKWVDASGCFELRGSAKDFIGDIEPALYIYHYCGKNREKPWCPNKNKINLSKLKIYTESANPIWNDVGTLNLENGQSMWAACGHKFMHPSTWGDNKQPAPQNQNMQCPWEKPAAPGVPPQPAQPVQQLPPPVFVPPPNDDQQQPHHHHHKHHHHHHKEQQQQTAFWPDSDANSSSSQQYSSNSANGAMASASASSSASAGTW